MNKDPKEVGKSLLEYSSDQVGKILLAGAIDDFPSQQVSPFEMRPGPGRSDMGFDYLDPSPSDVYRKGSNAVRKHMVDGLAYLVSNTGSLRKLGIEHPERTRKKDVTEFLDALYLRKLVDTFTGNSELDEFNYNRGEGAQIRTTTANVKAYTERELARAVEEVAKKGKRVRRYLFEGVSPPVSLFSTDWWMSHVAEGHGPAIYLTLKGGKGVFEKPPVKVRRFTSPDMDLLLESGMTAGHYEAFLERHPIFVSSGITYFEDGIKGIEDRETRESFEAAFRRRVDAEFAQQ